MKILDKDVAIINRIEGSGTRILLDGVLEKIAQERNISIEEITSKLNGYYTETRTHGAVAAAVNIGRADVGLAIRTVAVQYDLDFIPIQNEEYDFLFSKEAFESETGKLIVEILRSKDFEKKLSRKYSGLYTTKKTGLTINF